MNTVIVTGAAGFLGSHLAEHYLIKGHKVIGIDNFLCSDRKNVDLLERKYPQFNFLAQDVTTSWDSVESHLEGSLLYVLHFACPASPKNYQNHPFETIGANTTGLLNALRFSHKHNGRTIFASSSEVYGDPLVPIQSEGYWGNVNTFGPRSCYDESKRMGESIIYEFNRLHGQRHGLVRIFNTYGPRMNHADGRVIINFLIQAEKNLPLTVYGDGSQTRSFCYVDDLILGIGLYANSSLSEPINLGNPQENTIHQLTQQIRDLYNDREVHINYEPLPTDDPQRRRPDIQKAQSLLGWTPEVSIAEGLTRMRSWLQNEN